VPKQPEDCFQVEVVRIADGKTWHGAIHFVVSTSTQRAETRIRSSLQAAFHLWNVDSIEGVFEIPRILLPERPQPHRCAWFDGEEPPLQ
jgi:hypothetical protein